MPDLVVMALAYIIVCGAEVKENNKEAFTNAIGIVKEHIYNQEKKLAKKDEIMHRLVSSIAETGNEEQIQGIIKEYFK